VGPTRKNCLPALVCCKTTAEYHGSSPTKSLLLSVYRAWDAVLDCIAGVRIRRSHVHHMGLNRRSSPLHAKGTSGGNRNPPNSARGKNRSRSCFSYAQTRLVPLASLLYKSLVACDRSHIQLLCEGTPPSKRRREEVPAAMAAVREEARMRAAVSLLGSGHQGPALCRGVEVACYRCPAADAIVDRDLMTSGSGAYWITRTCETSARALPNPRGRRSRRNCSTGNSSAAGRLTSWLGNSMCRILVSS
jgi:hypothetical protein